jgi:tRNA pseudouridine38-40 synthase
MVRILTGTLLEVGCAEKSIEDIKMALEQKERELTGFLAPARGLFLEKVYYQEGEER